MAVKLAIQTEVAEVDEENEPAGELQPAEDGSTENDGTTADEEAATGRETTEPERSGGTNDNDSSDNSDPGASDSSGDTSWLTYEATAYIALCDSGCSGVTATGIDVRDSIYHDGDRIIAVDPAVIPLGSRVEVRLADGSVFTAQAQDTGGAIKGAKIDVLVATEAEAWDFGRQSVEVRILND